MIIFRIKIYLIIQIFFVTIFFSTLQAKILNKFNEGNYIADYFSGTILLNNEEYDESYSYLKKLAGLEENHLDYSKKYLYSLVNLGKFNEAFRYSKKLEKKKISIFENNLIIGIYYLKNKNYQLANKYFQSLKDKESRSLLGDFVSNALLNWTSFGSLDFQDAKKKIIEIDPKFENLKRIQNVFVHCFYGEKKTEIYFDELTSNEKIDFSRYNYFYAQYLISNGQSNKAKKIVESSLELYPRNLLLNQLKINLQNKRYKNNFNCEKLTNVIAEIFYITANALSTQNLYKLSNFYLNLAKFLNQDFYSFDALLAENFYKIDNYKKAKKIYKEIGRHGEAFLWFSSKQNAKILITEDQNEKALTLIRDTYERLSQKDIYETYDYATFLKNNDQFQESIKFYTEILKKINKGHPLYPKVKDGRGVSHERLGEWEKAEVDLQDSLKAKPDQAYVINYLAYSWIEQGIKIEKSLKMLEKANSLKSNDPYIIDSLGWALFKLKRYKDSKDQIQLAVELMPADPVVNDHFADVLWMNGKKIQARYYWKYVLGLDEVEEDLKIKIKKKLISGL